MYRGSARVVVVLGLMGMLAIVALGQSYPNCRWNCKSGDVSLGGLHLVAPSSCTPGSSVTGTLYGSFANNTGTNRYDVALIADLIVTTSSGTTTTGLNIADLTSDIPPGTSDLPIARISFPCGASVELRNVIISWDTKEGGDLSCSSRSSKCSDIARVVVTGIPLAADFSSSAPACAGQPVSFTDQTTGGTSPYDRYDWNFGDSAGTSTKANPTYTYSTPGTYTVRLDVFDGRASSTITHAVTILAVPSAQASNGGPYCLGSTIALFASGGLSSYAWSGPNGFKSSTQNPTVANGAAGIYTVTVTNASGCSSTASTNVVVDGTPPVLTLPANVTVACGGSVLPASTGQASASDIAGSSVTVTYADVVTPGTCGNTGTIRRTWTATDACGQAASGVQTITVLDTTPPSLTISSLTLECDGAGNTNAIQTWLQSAVAADTCGAVTVTNNYTSLSGACAGVGQAEVTFVATDACGNVTQRTATLRVQDTIAPIAVSDAVIVEADATARIDVLDNDSDVCNTELALVSVATPARGTATVSGTTVAYTAPATEGADSFTYVIEDCSGIRSTGQVTVSVFSSNHRPVANDVAVTTAEDTTVDLTLTASDPDGDVLDYEIVSGPSNGSITAFNSATGSISYMPGRNYFGFDEIRFRVCDPDGACSQGTATITITSVDDQIIAYSQNVETPEDTAIAIQVSGIDEDGNPVEYAIWTGPAHGEISEFNATTGMLIYTPSPHFTGTDSFVFKVCDLYEDDECVQATVTISVTAVNDAPVATNQTRATAEDTETGFFALSISDPDNTLAELICDCVSPPQHGSVERGPGHTVNYTPEPNYTGTDTFTYNVCDPDGLCDTATVTVTVSAENDNPSVDAGSQTTPEDTAIDIVVTHSDADGDALTCTASTPAHGTVTPQLNTIQGPYPVNGTLTYTPKKDFVGVDQIVVRCDDGNGGSDSVTIEITVTAVNDRPVANDGLVTMSEDTATSITVTGSDVDGEGLTYTIIGSPNHGTITGFNSVTGGFIYTPGKDYAGADEIIFQVCDPSNACDTGVVTITIEPVDDNPVPDPQTVTTPEDVAKVIVLTATEPDGEALSYGIVSGPSHGRITGFNEATGELTYEPNENYAGDDSFVFEACDPDAAHGCPQATVTITVTPVNDPPLANDESITTTEGRAVDVILTGSDIDGDRLAFTILSGPGHGQVSGFDGESGSLTYTPDPLFFGSDSFTFTVCDPSNACSQGTVTIDVVAQNDPPTANDKAVTTAEDAPVNLTLTASDPDGDDLVYSIVTGPGHGAITGLNHATGELIYTPTLNFHGEDTFTFEVCDPDGECNGAVVTITVEAADDLPVPDPQAVETPEDRKIAIQLTGTDVDGEIVTYQLVSGPSHGMITGFDSMTGELIYTPSVHFTGTDGFVFAVCDSHDDHGCPQATVTILVTPVNDAPVANSQTRATAEDTATGFFALSISDPDNALDELTVEIGSYPLHGEIEVGPNLTANYTPDPNYTGMDTMTVIVCDPYGLCDTATLTITVSAENDNPSVLAPNQTTPEDKAIDIPVTHADPDGDGLTCTASTPTHGTVNPQSGTISGPYPETDILTYTPDKDFAGVDQIVVRCDDGNGGSDSVTIEITVTGVNDRPEANDESVTLSEDTQATITMTASDADGDELRYEVIGSPGHGVVTAFDESTGVLTYEPAKDYHGADEITFQVCDAAGACDTGVLSIDVQPVDDNPIPDPQSIVTAEDVGKAIVLTATEPDGEALSYGIVSGPSHGRITGFIEATGELTYVPNGNYVGGDSFVFEACDPDAAHGCPQATVTITVTPVNDPPLAGTAIETTREDTSLSAALPGSDVDDAVLRFSVLVPPALGEIRDLNPATGRFTYVPSPNASGDDAFDYEVCDPSGSCAQGSIQIRVIPVNDPPSAQFVAARTLQDEPVDLQLLATDPDSSDLTFSLLLAPRLGTILEWDENTGVVRYQPAPGNVGVDSFLYRVCDPQGACDSRFARITIIDVNDPPQAAYLETAINQGELTPLNARATDADEEPLTFSIISGPLHGSVSSFNPTNGAFEYVSESTYVGPDLIRYQVCDAAGACDIGVIQLNVVRAGGGGEALAVCPNVVISEIAWAGTAAGEDQEWIELRNLESFSVDLGGWVLRWRAILPQSPEDRAWRTIRLTGEMAESQPDQLMQLEPSRLAGGTWSVLWAQGSSPDYFLIEFGDDDVVVPELADLVFPSEDEFGLATRLPDEGAILELIGPSGCLVDTANIDWLPGADWSAGSTKPPASMERTDVLAEDIYRNWHTNLGLVRTGFDAIGNLLHGTPKGSNSPILAEVAGELADESTRTPVGEPIQLSFTGNPLWSADPQLWHVVITGALQDDALSAVWEVVEQSDGSTSILVQTNLLPPNVPLHLWVRTPTGEVLLAPILLYPY